MPSLKSLLSQVDAKRGARLELVSGRRPRLVFEDRPGARGDIRNLADEILTDDEVVALCEAAGAGRRLDALDDGPQAWTHQGAAGSFRVTAELRGREIAAVFAPDVQRRLSAAPKSRRSPSVREQPAARSTRGKGDEGRAGNRSASPAQARAAEREGAGRSLDRPPIRTQTTPPQRVRQITARSASRPGQPVQRQVHIERLVTIERPPPERSIAVERPPVERTAQVERRPVERGDDVRGGDRPPVDDRPPPRQAPPERERVPAMERPPPEQARPRDHREPSRRELERRGSESPSLRGQARAKILLRVAWPEEHGTASRLIPVLGDGRRLGASDLHLVPGRPALLRIAGSLAPTRDSFPTAETERAIFALVPERLRGTFEKRGGVDFALDLQKVGRLRVNVTMTLGGVKAALRFLPRDAPTLASLGMPARLIEATEHHQGLVIVTGPTGHGKTSTLAALVDHLSENSATHVICVEDPIEIIHRPKKAIVSQREIGSDTKSFARALSGALRQDPDVIVIGELRDTETVRIALAAAETGHLVMGTMNTPSAAATVEALIDLFPPGDQPQVRSTLAGALKYIVSQRLVPKADGTARVAAVEILPGNMSLWNLIRDQKTFQLKSLMQRGRSLGIVQLNDSLAELVANGTITKPIAMMSSDSPEELAGMLSGPEPPPLEERSEDGLGGLLHRAGAFFTRKGGDE